MYKRQDFTVVKFFCNMTAAVPDLADHPLQFAKRLVDPVADKIGKEQACGENNGGGGKDNGS